MAGDGSDAGVPARELGREEDVGRFGLAVALKGGVVRHAGRGRCEVDAAFGRVAVAGGTQ